MDRLDEINRNNAYKNHLIKWWNVNMQQPETETTNNTAQNVSSGNIGNYDDVSAIVSSFDEDVQQVCDSIFTASKHESVFEEAMNKMQVDEANAIYERLMREAQEDEMIKQNEIEMAKQVAGE